MDDALKHGSSTCAKGYHAEKQCQRQQDLIFRIETEFQLLAALARHPGRVFTRNQLLDAIRGEPFESFDRAIDAHVKNLRRKIEPDPRRPRYVLTVYGLGYKCAAE